MSRHQLGLIVVAASLVISGCSSGWSDEEREQMLSVCRSSAGTNNELLTTCFCAVDYLEEHYASDEVDEGAFARAFKECQ